MAARLRSPSRFNRTHRGLASRGSGVSYRTYRRIRKVRAGLSATILVLTALSLLLGGAGSARAEPPPPPSERTYRLLVVPVVPADLYNGTLHGPDPGKVNPWYADNGSDAWDGVSRALEGYFGRITYGRFTLEVDSLPWQPLPRSRSDYARDRELQLLDSLRIAEGELRAGDYDAIAVVDATSPADPRFRDDWPPEKGWGLFHPRCRREVGCIHTGTFYPLPGETGEAAVARMVKVLAHEMGHAIELDLYGRYVLPHGEEDGAMGLMGPAYPALPLLNPIEEERLLGTRLSPSAGGRPFLLSPREQGPGLWLRIAPPPGGSSPGKPEPSPPLRPAAGPNKSSCSDGRYVLEYRLVLAPPLVNGSGVLLWCDAGGRMTPHHIFHHPGEYSGVSEEMEVTLRVESMGPEGARGTIQLQGALS